MFAGKINRRNAHQLRNKTHFRVFWERESFVLMTFPNAGGFQNHQRLAQEDESTSPDF